MSQSEILRFLLQGDSRNLTSALDEANSRLDGAKDAAERAAVAIELLTEAAETRMRGAAQATEALSAALGQDTVAAIERAGGSVDGWVADLNRAGVAYDEIAAKADRFAGVIRNAEGVAGNLNQVNDSAVRASGGVDRLGSSSDQTRSVLANMVGNSLQDLGALGGVAGTAGVALGQLGEYAADGNINMGNLVALAGPMAGLGLATLAVSKAAESAAENARIAKEETQLWLDLQAQFDPANMEPPDLGPTAEALVDQYQGTIEALEQLGYSVQDFVAITRGDGQATLDALNARQAELGRIAASSTDGLLALTEAQRAEYDILTALTPNLAGYAAAQANSIVQYDLKQRRVAEMKAALEAEREATAAAAGGWVDWANKAGNASRSTADDIQDMYESMGAAAQAQIEDTTARLQDWLNSLAKIPDAKRTEIQAAIDAGQIGRAEQLLNQLARNRYAAIFPTIMPATTSKGAAAAGSGTKGTSTVYNPGNVLKDMIKEANAASSGGGGGGGGGGGRAEPDEPTPEEQAREWENAVRNLFELDEFSLDDYRNFLQGQLGLYEVYSDDYKRIWSSLRELDQIESDKVAAFQDANKNMFDTGQMSLSAYREFLQGQLGLYASYSDDYKRIWSGLRELDRMEQDEKDKAAEAEKKRADEAKKAAEEAARAQEKQLDALRQLVTILNQFVTMQYGNLEGSNVTGAGAAGLMTSDQLGGVLAGLIGTYVDGVS